MKKLLAEGVAIGNATARSISFSPRKKSVYFFEDRQWTSPFAGLSYEFMNNGERVLDDRTFFHYVATGITPAMAAPKVGAGSVYAFRRQGRQRRILGRREELQGRHAQPGPREQLLVIHRVSGQHRSMLETDQKLPAWTAITRRANRIRTVRIPCGSGPRRGRATRATGSRPCRARATTCSCACTVHCSRGLTRLGSRAILNWCSRRRITTRPANQTLQRTGAGATRRPRV